MDGQPDIILIVDDDPEVRTLLRDHVFSSKDFWVIEAHDSVDALHILQERIPDLVMLALDLPGLTGHDMLVAIHSQGYQGPVIAMAGGHGERSVIEAFRLGASDYLIKPLRETEVAAVVERGLKAVRLRRQRDSLLTRLEMANRELKARVKELTALYEIGHSVTSLRDLETLFQRVLNSATALTGADHAFLLLGDDKLGRLVLRAGQNLRLNLLDRMGEPMEDQLATLVMSSLEALNVSGDSLRQYTTERDLFAVAYVPLTLQAKAIGVLAVGNHETQTAFTANDVRLLTALADYASIAIVNARLFSMLDQRAQSMESAYQELQERDRQRGRQLQIVLTQLLQPLVVIEAELVHIARGDEGKISKSASQRLASVRRRVRYQISLVNRLAQHQR